MGFFDDVGKVFTTPFQVAGGVVDNMAGTNIFGPNATDKAIRAQQDATDKANQVQMDIFQLQRADYQPWREVGARALTGLENPNFQQTFSLDKYQQDPGYQFRLQEGIKAINSAASARGMGNSGATLKALTKYGQDYASNEYQNAYNRWNNDQSTQFNRLSTLAGFGQNATNQSANAAGNYGNQTSSNLIGMGNAQGAAQIGIANRQAQLVGQGATAAALAFSDERLKTNITPISKEDLEEMKFFLKAYAFNYQNIDHGVGDWVGVMAQDLEKSKLGKTLVVEDENGNKQIDLKKVLSMFLAVIAEA